MGLRGIGSHPKMRRTRAVISEKQRTRRALDPDGQREAQHELTHKRRMALLFGPAPEWMDAFSSQEEFDDCWRRNREELLADCPAGRRPMGWWQVEAPIAWPGHDGEKSALWAANLLSDAERGELERTWRGHFDEARAPDFWLSTGGQILKGEAARRAHHEWADIPAELVERWSAELESDSEAAQSQDPLPAA
jgi:hypothetical protein